MGLSFLKYMNMRKIILLICILSVFITCNFYKKSNKLDIQKSVKEKLSSNKFKHERGTFYSINIDLYNNTDTTISFWVISCPFWENLILKETHALNFYYGGCDNVGIFLKQIAPNKKLTFKEIIQISDDSTNNNNIKLGLILIKKNELPDSLSSDFEFFDKLLSSKRKKQKDIIWSEPFTIP